jgi:hypothetical protein
LGTSGATIGHAHLPGALSEAAVLCLRNTPHGQKLLARVEKTPDTGQARTILAHPLARAVSSLRKRQTACDRDVCRRPSGSGAGAPDASLDASREAPEVRVLTSSLTAAVHATVRLGPVSLRLTR